MTLLTDTEIEEKLLMVEDWELEEAESLIITKNFEFNTFDEAVEFVNKLKDIANKENHHPDILIYGFKYVEIMFTTHDENGLTELDFNCAIQIDALYNELKN